MRADVLTLDEYGEAEIALTPADAQRLRALARERLSVQIGDSPTTWRVKATSYVGTIVLPTLKILIRPKVTTANLFYLLEADSRPLSIGDEQFEYDQTDDLMAAFATFYARHLEVALGQGITREYREETEQLAGLRGRVDITAQLRGTGLALPLACRFDEYTADIQLNRILLGAAMRLASVRDVTLPTRRALRQLCDRLVEVRSPRAADLDHPTVFTRLNEHCRPAERLARMVFRDLSLLDRSGTAGAAVFLVDMNRVFESFIETRLRRNLAGRLTVTGQWRDRLDTAGDVPIRPDLVFGSAIGGVTYVADAKYKVTSDGFGRHADYYQLLAYTTALGLGEGLLIYCQHDGGVLPREVQARNVGTRLGTWAVRLDRSPQHVDEEMRELAAHILHRAEVPSALVTTTPAVPT